jgi:hypothetical protein
MSRVVIPAGPQSSTALAGKSDYQDQNVYSSLGFAHSGTGQQKMFTVPQGQTIPFLRGSATATTNAHQQTYSDLTTNLVEAGKLGNAIGDASFRGLSVQLEQAAFNNGTAAIRGFGATQFEVADILSKVSFEFKVAGKRQIIGPVHQYPATGGVSGSVASTASAADASGVISLANNGGGWGARKLISPIEADRNDTLEGIMAVATGSTLAFGVTTGEGQPLLAWVNLFASVLGDVR